MKTPLDILHFASSQLNPLEGHVFDVLNITKPVSIGSAVNLVNILSKLSPVVGNLIEFNLVELLNERDEFKDLGRWYRQDPGFPDAVFQGLINPAPGLEIKTWFPLATEITARFRESQSRFLERHVQVVMLAWLPEHIIYGRPKIVAVSVVDAQSIAFFRDQHYHNPPDYLVVEPEDTALRTRNLQQTNASGYKWQGSAEQFEIAQQEVNESDRSGEASRDPVVRKHFIRGLLSRYPYRLDTNFAKIDRIGHPDIEAFKRRVYQHSIHGNPISEWSRLLRHPESWTSQDAVTRLLGITDADADNLVK